MTEHTAHFNPAGKSEPTRHISMEITADAARVTALTLTGTRLVVTIEAELSASKVKTSADSPAPAVPPAEPRVECPAPRPPEPAAVEPESVRSESARFFPADMIEPRNQPESGQPEEQFPPAPAESGQEYDGLLAIRKKSAGPIIFGPDDSQTDPQTAEMGSGQAEPVHGLTSEAAELDVEPAAPPVTADQAAVVSSSASFRPAASRWDDQEPVESVSGKETRVSQRAKAPAEPENAPESPSKHPESGRGDAKPLSFEFAMAAADKPRTGGEPKSDAPARAEGKVISFGPLLDAEPMAQSPAGNGENDLFEQPNAASAPPEPIPLSRQPGMGIDPVAAPSAPDPGKSSLLETVPAGKLVPSVEAPAPAQEPRTRWPSDDSANGDDQPIPGRGNSPFLDTAYTGQMLSSVKAPDMSMGGGFMEAEEKLSPIREPEPQFLEQESTPTAIPPPPGAPIRFAGPSEDAAQSEDSNVLGGERHGEPKPSISFGFENTEPGEASEQKPAAPTPPAPTKEGEPGKGTAKPEAGGTTVLIRYTCPKCKTQGMQAVDKVGTVVNCSNCGKAMRLVMKK
ncbi:MAG: hypothetical protein LBT97_11015 [Planctomycetota bacterium]|jgi:hypothetical protein|nr:hypothetical protein [Planctomycetota bacterium]